MRIVNADLVKLLLENGWRRAKSTLKGGSATFTKRGAVITLNAPTVELLDRLYSQGHRDGWERGAYEEMTCEDVEPVVHKFDPDGPEIPDLAPEDE